MSAIITLSPDKTASEEMLKKLYDLFGDPKSKLDLFKKLPGNKKISKKEIISSITDAYQNERLVLVLGAGVSMGFGLPNWDILLQELMITTIEKEQSVSTVLSKLFNGIFSPSPLIAGRYLQKFYEDKKLVFEAAVQKVLYKNLNIHKESPLMDEIVNFCVAPGKTPNIDSIITYNFDDILEQRIKKVGIDVPVKSIYGVGMNSDGKLPIYHVHGFLPEDEVLSLDNQITFGESIYHKQYIDIYSWNNIVQINKFRDNTCIFIGSSLTDPNIRRLLDIARRQKGDDEDSHFIFKMRHKESVIRDKLEALLKENQELLTEKDLANLEFDKAVKFLIDIIERFEESDTKSFGVRTIWITEWDEIPKMLKEIRKSGLAKQRTEGNNTD